MNNARFLDELSLPDAERNLIVGIHHYWPIMFTMQGEMWLGEDHMDFYPDLLAALTD